MHVYGNSKHLSKRQQAVVVANSVVVSPLRMRCPFSHEVKFIGTFTYEKKKKPFLKYFCPECKLYFTYDNRLQRNTILELENGELIYVIAWWECDAGPEFRYCEQISPFKYRYELKSFENKTEYVDTFPEKCSEDGGDLHILDVSSVKTVEPIADKAMICDECFKIFLMKKHYPKNKSQKSNKEFQNSLPSIEKDTKVLIQKKKQKEDKTSLYGTTSFKIDKIYDVYVYYKLTNQCMVRHSENILPATLITSDSIFSYKEYKINAFYCSRCNKYFINSDLLRGYIKEKSYPLFRYHVFKPDYELKEFSELWLLGYNVRKGELSKRQRKRLLTRIIENKLLTKQYIIRQLQFYIDFNGRNPKNQDACEKWEEDIKFVSSYTEDNTRSIHGQLLRK